MFKKPFIFAYAFNAQLRSKFRNWFFGLAVIYSFAMVLFLFTFGSIIGRLVGWPPRAPNSYLLDFAVLFLVPYFVAIWLYVKNLNKV